MNKQFKLELTGSTLKWIAIVTMLIDHIGAIVLEKMVIASGWDESLYLGYMVLRLIGRFAFPIFCFLLVEGFLYTRNRKKYAQRLFLFALISEVPFDLACDERVWDLSRQNVFFTLFFGFVGMMVLETIEQKEQWNRYLRMVFCMAAAGAVMGFAHLLHTDYAAFGVLTILVMYLFRFQKTISFAAGCLVLTVMDSYLEPITFLGVILIFLYNGKKGSGNKWFFYVFYPAHLLILWGLSKVLMQ